MSDKPRGRKPRGMPRWRSIAGSMAIGRTAVDKRCAAWGMPTVEIAAVDDRSVGYKRLRCVCMHSCCAMADAIPAGRTGPRATSAGSPSSACAGVSRACPHAACRSTRSAWRWPVNWPASCGPSPIRPPAHRRTEITDRDQRQENNGQVAWGDAARITMGRILIRAIDSKALRGNLRV